MTKTTKRFYKHKLLLDEDVPSRKYFPSLNRRFDVKHVGTDLGLESSSDLEVHNLARKQGRLIVTRNIKHFQKLAQISNDTGIIGVSSNLTFKQIDTKLTALLNKSTRKSLLGKITQISGKTEAE